MKSANAEVRRARGLHVDISAKAGRPGYQWPGPLLSVRKITNTAYQERIRKTNLTKSALGNEI